MTNLRTVCAHPLPWRLPSFSFMNAISGYLAPLPAAWGEFHDPAIRRGPRIEPPDAGRPPCPSVPK